MTAFADCILTAPTVHTLDPTRPHASAVAIADGRIVAVGEPGDMAELRGGATRTVHVPDGVVTPGLVDGHLHPVLGISMTNGVDLSGCTDLDDLRATLRGVPAEPEWIRGWGLDPNIFGDVAITSAQIEDAVGNRPTLLVIFDGHAALVNREALHRAGIDGPRRFDSNSQIVCGPDGRPTGHLLEHGAIQLVAQVIPAEPVDVSLARLKDLFAGMAAAGLTGGHVMDLEQGAMALYAALDDAGDLPLRLRAAPWCHPDDDRDRIAEIIDWQGRSGALWRVAAVKLFMDGTIDGGTAWLDEPDCHGQSTRSYWRDPGDYTETVRRFANAGIQTATHAIGDAAVRHVLDSLAGATSPGAPVRHRIEHIETLPTELVGRFVELGVVASMQPTHATDYTRADHSDNWSRRLGDERADRAWRCRDLLDAGVTLVLGSDWPIAPFDPRGIIAAAQLRRPAGHPELDPVTPQQALTAKQALLGYTRAAAEVAGEQGESGRIAVGMRADLTVFGADPLTTPAQDFAQAPMRLTIVDGVVRYQHNSVA